MRVAHQILPNDLAAMKASPIHEFTRNLRRDQTDAVRKLWYRLRLQQVAGLRFRRQFPIGNFIVDFCCREERLVAELDGGQHMHHAEVDRKRTELIKASGYRVLRFWNSDVLNNTDGMLEQILSALRLPSPWSGSGQGEGFRNLILSGCVIAYSPCLRRRSNRRGGDIGRSVTRMPSARDTALATAAGGGMIGTSPTPRTPSG